MRENIEVHFAVDFYDRKNRAKARMMVGVETEARSWSSIDEHLGSGDAEEEFEASDDILNVSGPPRAKPDVDVDASHRCRQLTTQEFRVDKDLKLVAG